MVKIRTLLRVLAALTALMILPSATNAQEVEPGNVVRLVERDIHIPAHPAPGDRAVHLRFVSGSTATVLAKDQQTGWLELRGIPLSGTQNTGWITRTYIAEIEDSSEGEFD